MISNWRYYSFRSLCDIKHTGKLNNEQFALAMWLINQKVKGIDPPKALTPEMVPPCLRSKPEGQVVSFKRFLIIISLFKILIPT